MYKTVDQVKAYLQEFVPLVKGHDRDQIVLCPPFVYLGPVTGALRGSQVFVGAQDMFWEKEGPYTGEISSHMLLGAGCRYVIIGHSERRQYFGETDETVNRKLKACLEVDLRPIVCVGEVLQEREAGLTREVLERQCNIAFSGIDGPDAMPMIVAYEPVWAIGTGKTATPEMAAEAHRIIRAQAEKAFGESLSESLRILYGGSVKPDNIKALMAQEEIDGALVGGASLDPKSFAAIVKY
jgi:triosephosphate isomerase